MSRTYRRGRDRNIKIKIHAIRRDKPDFKRLSKFLITMAVAELEKEAKSQHHKPGFAVENVEVQS